MKMGIARISAASTEGQQPFLLGHLRAAPTQIKSARDISLQAQLCDD